MIFSKTDLTLNGTGSLTIQAQAGHGVVSKDELVVTQGSYTITAASHGLSGKDSIAIAGGSFHITSGKDGIHAENSDDTSMGFLYIADGTFTIAAQGDAVSASGALLIDSGPFDLTTGEGSASVTMSSDSSFGQMGGVPTEISAAEEDTISQKGIKAEGSFTINGGTLDLTCNGSGNTALDTDGTYAYNGGTVTTNDGSENNPGQMGGGGRGGMAGGDRPDDMAGGGGRGPFQEGSEPSDLQQPPA